MAFLSSPTFFTQQPIDPVRIQPSSLVPVTPVPAVGSLLEQLKGWDGGSNGDQILKSNEQMKWTLCPVGPNHSCFGSKVKSSQVPGSGATRPRGDHPDPYLSLPPAVSGLWRSDWGRQLGGISAGQPACYRNCPDSRYALTESQERMG